jgi:hypothetical protein
MNLRVTAAIAQLRYKVHEEIHAKVENAEDEIKSTVEVRFLTLHAERQAASNRPFA